MKHNLMGKESMENLGFDKVNAWENEEQRKQDLFRKLVEIDKMAERNINRMRGGDDEFDNNLYEV